MSSPASVVAWCPIVCCLAVSIAPCGVSTCKFLYCFALRRGELHWPSATPVSFRVRVAEGKYVSIVSRLSCLLPLSLAVVRLVVIVLWSGNSISLIDTSFGPVIGRSAGSDLGNTTLCEP